MGYYKHPPYRHNVFIVPHGIIGSNKQIPLTGPNKPPHQGRGSTMIPFVTKRIQHVDIVRFGPKGTFTALKRVYMVKNNLYLYNTRNFLPYLM